MGGKKLAMFLLLVLALELLFFASEAKPWLWRRRRRRRRCSSSIPSGTPWANSWHQYFSKRCPIGSSLRYWYSRHRNCKEDRIHYFHCGYTPIRYSERNCASTYYQNDYDKPLTFRCSHNGFITGVTSDYNGAARDRRFKFRCCHVPGYIQHSCKHTPYLNSWDQPVSYLVPHGHYLVGVHSYHHNRYEDRRWRFEICKINKSSGK